jgi:signal transduction histidine kinase
LAISKKIIEQAGGEISVESAAGNGTSFTVLLPVAVS